MCSAVNISTCSLVRKKKIDRVNKSERGLVLSISFIFQSICTTKQTIFKKCSGCSKKDKNNSKLKLSASFIVSTRVIHSFNLFAVINRTED